MSRPISSNTKLVEYWVDLYPGWHDNSAGWKPCMNTVPLIGPKPNGGLRVRVLVELPCIGSVDVDRTQLATTEVEQGGAS